MSASRSIRTAKDWELSRLSLRETTGQMKVDKALLFALVTRVSWLCFASRGSALRVRSAPPFARCNPTQPELISTMP
jgi:hypothetical protein